MVAHCRLGAAPMVAALALVSRTTAGSVAAASAASGEGGSLGQLFLPSYLGAFLPLAFLCSQ
jgi:hypothetical protein